eukprot:NODE_734_length_1941_cov_32.284355_g680_i0.p1 GENE.NODE_734_length_1941_cov_32.284355_g680_i0~~NODE_734_length_1941_cov_32.284355_g680_i0.p1  ORF type:complete len:596 (+),score=143.48 NODE_734_length_1941_cov_32.284355_g680_i0:94-1788(+)
MALMISPARELSLQIAAHLEAVAKHTNIVVQAIVGGIYEEKQIRLLKRKPHIVVCTPGRLNQLLTEEDVPFLRHSISNQLRFLVLDEADRLLEQHHFVDLNSIFERINLKPKNDGWGETNLRGVIPENEIPKNVNPNLVRTFNSCFQEFNSLEEFNAKAEEGTPQIRYLMNNDEEDKPRREGSKNKARKQAMRRQILITSATLTLSTKWKDGTKKLRKWNPEDPDAVYLDSLVARIGVPLKNFKMIDVNPDHKMVASMKELMVNCLDTDKDLYLYYFFKMFPGRTIVFVNAISCLRRVSNICASLDVPAWPIHAGMQQRQRLKNLDRFRDTENGIIIATDVLGRGVDIKGVLYVVHYQFPRNTEIYTHRCGRTARAFKPGLALSLISSKEQMSFKQVCFSLGYRAGLEELPIEETVIQTLRPIVSTACEIDRIESKQRRTSCELNWWSKMSKEMDIEIDEDVVETYKEDPHAKKMENLRLKTLRRELKEMVSQPLMIKKGAYLHSGANLTRQEILNRTIAFRIDPNAESVAPSMDDGSAQQGAKDKKAKGTEQRYPRKNFKRRH